MITCLSFASLPLLVELITVSSEKLLKLFARSFLSGETKRKCSRLSAIEIMWKEHSRTEMFIKLMIRFLTRYQFSLFFFFYWIFSWTWRKTHLSQKQDKMTFLVILKKNFIHWKKIEFVFIYLYLILLFWEISNHETKILFVLTFLFTRRISHVQYTFTKYNWHYS